MTSPAIVNGSARRGRTLRSIQSLPVNETEGSSNASSRIITGYFPELWIGVRAELQIELLKEVFAANYQYGLLASLRVDIQLAHPGSFCQIKGVL